MKQIVFLCFWTVVTGFTIAQDFSVKVSSQNLYEDQIFTLEMVVPTTQVQKLVYPSFSDFQVLQGPWRENFYQNFNGKVSAGVRFNWKLRPKSAGTFSISSAEMRLGGKDYKTEPIRITVKKVSGVLKKYAKNKDMFVLATVSKKNPYVGEQIVMTTELYTCVGTGNQFSVKGAKLDGFWTKNLKVDISDNRLVLNGKTWIKYTVGKSILVPQKSGELVIKGYKLNLSKEVQVRRGFFTMSDYQPVELAAPPIKVNVKSLPQPRPQGFSGAVGEFKFEGLLNKSDVQTNDAIDYKVVLSGKGNFQLIQLPKPKFSTDFEVYDPKIKNNYKVKTSGTRGQKSASYLTIPRNPGSFEISSLQFTYFDLKKKSYVTLKSPAYQINVKRGKGDETTVFDGKVRKQEVIIGDDEIRFIKTSNNVLTKKGKYFIGSIVFWSVVSILLIALILMFLLKRKVKSDKSDLLEFKNKKANKVARKYLQDARKSRGDESRIYELTSKAIYGYLSDKLKLAISELNIVTIKSSLSTAIDDEFAEEMVEILEFCEMVKYAPNPGVTPDQLLEKTEKLITQIENRL